MTSVYRSSKTMESFGGGGSQKEEVEEEEEKGTGEFMTQISWSWLVLTVRRVEGYT